MIRGRTGIGHVRWEDIVGIWEVRYDMKDTGNVQVDKVPRVSKCWIVYMCQEVGNGEGKA